MDATSPWTLLAPTNAAIEFMLGNLTNTAEILGVNVSDIAAIAEPTEELVADNITTFHQNLLAYHILPGGAFSTADLANYTTITTAAAWWNETDADVNLAIAHSPLLTATTARPTWLGRWQESLRVAVNATTARAVTTPMVGNLTFIGGYTNATIIQADIPAPPGIIHVIDVVLMPHVNALFDATEDVESTELTQAEADALIDMTEEP
jgi:uncharacterized surface protein with fasciclin (FAS1) repeats